MTRQIVGRRVLVAVVIICLTAGSAFLLFRLTGVLYFIVGAPVYAIFGHPAPAIILPYLAVPLAGALFWRRPWWVRWIFVGLLVHNVALMVYIELTLTSSLFSD